MGMIVTRWMKAQHLVQLLLSTVLFLIGRLANLKRQGQVKVKHF